MRRVDGGPRDRSSSHFKIPTALLLNHNEEFVAFGYEAKEIYSDLEPSEQPHYLYFERFKMELQYTERIHRDMTLTAVNGSQVSAVTVFANALCYFKELFMQELYDQSSSGIVETAIRWVITVPAIWSQSAKQFMRLAAYEAGLLEEDGNDELLVALEPEAASIYCQKLKRWESLLDIPDRCDRLSPTLLKRNIGLGQRRVRFDTGRLRGSSVESSPTSSLSLDSPQSSQSPASPLPSHRLQEASLFSAGMRYLVVDCGGGTVDLTVHEMVKRGSLHELYKATGGAWGSVGVDQQFENLMYRIFGKEFVIDYQINRSFGWMELMENFEAKKRATSPLKYAPVNISLPFSFMEHYFNRTQCTVESAIQAYHNTDIQWSSQGQLRLHPDAMIALFLPVTEKIISHIRILLGNARLGGISHLFLVGGFAESQVLQQEVKKAFETQLRVVIPQDVSLTILKGAVYFGIDPTVIKVRRSALTYGIGVLNNFDPTKHPPDKRVIKGGQVWCTDIFEPFVHADEAVATDNIKVKRYMPAVSTQKSTTITLFASELENVQFVTDPGVRRVGELRLNLPPLVATKDMKYREIKICMKFGDTEINVRAIDCASNLVAHVILDLLCK